MEDIQNWMEVLNDREYCINENRLSFDEYGCLMAMSASSRSEDFHTKVGCCIVNENGRIISTGYNGLKKGFKLPKSLTREECRIIKGNIFIHSETNALSLIKKNEGHTIYLTHSPCISCANNIAANEIKRVVFIKEYHRSNEYKHLFQFYNIEHKEISLKEKENINKFIQSNMIIK